jgi:ankyrin repeat protein
VVRELVAQPGVDIDFRDPKFESRTALHCACINGHLQIVKLLVDHGASLQVIDNNGMTAFLAAAGAESLDVLKFMEEKGSDINALARDGRTSLHVCAAGNSISNMEYLLQLPALTHSLSTRTQNGRMVLHCAVEAGALETTRFVLQRSGHAELLSKTDDGHSCLHYAAMSGKPKMVSLFQDSGICHHDQTHEGLTALHYAAKSSNFLLFQALLSHIDLLHLTTHSPFANPTLLEPRASLQRPDGTWCIDDFVSGRRLDLPTNSGKTALQLLLSSDPFQYEHADMIHDIISRDGIDPEHRDREKKPPLIVLASRLSNHGENPSLRWAMKQLLDRGVDPNAQDSSGRTALHYLCDPKSFSTWICQAIGDIIGASADAFITVILPPPPPSGAGARRFSPSPEREVKIIKRRGRRASVSITRPVRVVSRPRSRSLSRSPSRSPSPSGITIIKSDEPGTVPKRPIAARVDIYDKTRETALQAFFRNLNRTHNPTQATAIAIIMLGLSKKDELDKPLANGSRLFNLAIICKNDKLIQQLFNLGVNTEERDSTLEHRSPL